MSRNSVSRVLLFALVGVTGILLYRMFQDTDHPHGVVVFDDGFGLDYLRHTAFEVEEAPVMVTIDATGSFQSDNVLAAYGWIVRRDDRAVVWTMRPETVTRDKGSTATIDDEAELAPGIYDAYFTSYGDPLQPATQGTSFFDKLSAFFDEDFRRWRTEYNKWKFLVQAASPEEASRVRQVSGTALRNFAWAGNNLIWETEPLHNNAAKEYLFQTDRDMLIQVYAQGEVLAESAPSDYGWIERIDTGEHIWELSYDNTEAAGGSIKNRIYNEVLRLPTGRYRVVYKTDGSHAYRRWKGNPPYDAAAWGIRLVTVDTKDLAGISDFDPWTSLPRVASLTRVGNSEMLNQTFTFDRPMRALVHAEGEFTSGGRYDYAWIINNQTERRIWEMEDAHTQHAGGGKKNRWVEEVIEFEPNIPYTVFYRSDDSHGYGSWNTEAPTNPERWGVTLFALDPTYVPPVPTIPEIEVNENGYLIQETALGNDTRIQVPFTVANRTPLHIVALGEFTRRDRYDYGWITRAGSDRVVWEMTRKNTTHAGGSSKNRKFDDVIVLRPGEYVVHFVTDDSYAFGDFDSHPPDNPTGWGITIRHANSRAHQRATGQEESAW